MTDADGNELEFEAHPALDVQVTDPSGGFVVRWVLVAEVFEADGVESLRTEYSHGMSDWAALGLVDYAAATLRPSGPC